MRVGHIVEHDAARLAEPGGLRVAQMFLKLFAMDEKLVACFIQAILGRSAYAHIQAFRQGGALQLPEGEDDSDFYFIERQEPDQVIALIKDLVTNRIPDRFGFDPMADIQVLTPMRRYQLGADNLNALLQEWLNPIGPQLERFGRAYRTGDRVMQIRR
jgi:ATP-dependent exoDNAse (exonuclease V) alpha subunit